MVERKSADMSTYTRSLKEKKKKKTDYDLNPGIGSL
jgi:hypothetical protein